MSSDDENSECGSSWDETNIDVPSKMIISNKLVTMSDHGIHVGKLNVQSRIRILNFRVIF